MAGKSRSRGVQRPYKDEKRGLWKVAVEMTPDPITGRRRRKYITSRDYNELLKKKRDFERDQEDGIDPRDGTVEQYLEDWLETKMFRTLSPGTFATYKSTVKRQINPSIGHKKLIDLKARDVDKMIKDITDRGMSTRTAEAAYRTLAKALKDAKSRGEIRYAATDAVDKPRVITKTREPLTAEEARHLIQTCIEAEDPYTTRWVFALLNGERQGEALGLRWRDLDLNLGLANIEWQLQAVKLKEGYRNSDDPDRFDVSPEQVIIPLHKGMALLPTKTSSSRRITPLVGGLWEALKAERESNARLNDFDLVWPSETGLPMRAVEDGKHWKAALKRAGLSYVSLHSARHTTASLLHELGVDEVTRMQILGHSSYLANRGYTHVSQDYSRAALERLDATLGFQPQIEG